MILYNEDTSLCFVELKDVRSAYTFVGYPKIMYFCVNW